MGGFFGVVSNGDCVDDLFYGVDYHSHLGTVRGGMAVTNPYGSIIRSIHDISNEMFRSKFGPELEMFRGAKCGIGIISDMDDQPLLIASHLGMYSIVTVGKLNNIEELTRQAIEEHHIHFAEHSNGEHNPTEVVASLINTQKTIEDGIAYAMHRIKGSCSLLVMADGKIYAARDRYGRTPVSLAKKPGAMAVAMETSAYPNLDYEFVRDLGPGEIVLVDAESAVQLKEPEETMQICSFLWVYFGYPSSDYEGRNTETVRYENGARIAAHDDVEVDSVCGVPDSGVAHAIGYSNKKGRPYLRALVKYTPTWLRSFMPQVQSHRNLIAKMKLLPVQDQIAGKRLLFCDDSIVRGTQFRDVTRRLLGRGAKEVHLRSASPPLAFPCLFLNFSRSRSVMDLAARRIIAELEGGEPTPEILREYITAGTPRYERMVEMIRRKLGLTTLKYQTIDQLVEAIGLPKCKLCTFCFDGCDPTGCAKWIGCACPPHNGDEPETKPEPKKA